MYKTLAFLFAAVVAATPAFAQMSPVGLWQSVDAKSGAVKADIRVTEQAGALVGRIEKMPGKDATLTCTKCEDDRKGLPMVGLEVVRGGMQTKGKEVWEGGKILDPEDGKEYSVDFTPVEGGKKLQLDIHAGIVHRTQMWQRLQ